MKLSSSFICANHEIADFDHQLNAPMFRKTFELDSLPKNAELTICGLGFYELYINGIMEYKGSNNRAYYAIFHAVNAVHALEENGYKRHKDAIANFNKQYVKTEIFPRSMGRKIGEAEEIRHASDYDDFYIASKEEAERQVEVADEFIRMVEEYINQRI